MSARNAAEKVDVLLDTLAILIAIRKEDNPEAVASQEAVLHQARQFLAQERDETKNTNESRGGTNHSPQPQPHYQRPTLAPSVASSRSSMEGA